MTTVASHTIWSRAHCTSCPASWAITCIRGHGPSARSTMSPNFSSKSLCSTEIREFATWLDFCLEKWTSPAWRTRHPSPWKKRARSSLVRFIRWTISVVWYMATRVPIASRRWSARSFSATPIRIPMDSAVPATCPGQMARPVTAIATTGFGVRKVSVCHVRAVLYTWCTAVGVLGTPLRPVAWRAAAVYSTHAVSATIHSPKTVASIVWAAARSIAPATRTAVPQAPSSLASSSATICTAKRRYRASVHPPNGYRNMDVSVFECQSSHATNQLMSQWTPTRWTSANCIVA